MTNANVQKHREAHHNALATVFDRPTSYGLNLWRKLRRIEATFSRQSLAFCNGELPAEDFEAAKQVARDAVARLTKSGKLPEGFFVNSDPRGYALKIHDSQAKQFPGLHRDWGGYGCLAAEINE